VLSLRRERAIEILTRQMERIHRRIFGNRTFNASTLCSYGTYILGRPHPIPAAAVATQNPITAKVYRRSSAVVSFEIPPLEPRESLYQGNTDCVIIRI
jgi:hypothetical protein